MWGSSDPYWFPIIHYLCINDINNHISSNGKLVLYADDCTYLYPTDDPASMINIINHDLMKLSNWYQGCKSSLNYYNTKSMVFHRGPQKKKIILHTITINGHVIEFKYHFGILAVDFDPKLTWRNHLAVISSHLSAAVGIIYKSRNILKQKWLMKLYQSITSIIAYITSIWGSASPDALKRKKIDILHRELLRLF